MGFRWVAERAILCEFDGDLIHANARARALCEAVREMPEVVDAVPGARSLLVRLNAAPREALVNLLESPPPASAVSARARHEIEVTYDGVDLDEVARMTGMSTDDVVAMHTGATYTVAFIGFSPGFPYLLGLPPALRVARLDTPRARVDAGSVAIAGEYAGVYPSTTPGGWRILGHTDARLLDAARTPPALLSAGDEVRFRPC